MVKIILYYYYQCLKGQKFLKSTFEGVLKVYLSLFFCWSINVLFFLSDEISQRSQVSWVTSCNANSLSMFQNQKWTGPGPVIELSTDSVCSAKGKKSSGQKKQTRRSSGISSPRE